MKNPNIEALKEVLRWVALFIVSWLITETLNQVGNVPEFFNVKVWVFSYLIPVRVLFTFGLTMLGRWIDKYLHEKSKLEDGKNKGLLPF